MLSAPDLLLATLRLRPTRSAEELRRAWQAVRTDNLARLLTFEGCSLWLYRRLMELDAVQALEAGFGAWLTRTARRIAVQNLLVDVQCDAVVRTLNELDCPHVLLKGAARRLVADLYPYADARTVGDVDVLLPRDLASSTWRRLRSAGFDAAPGAERRYALHHHLAPLSNERGVNVELHTSTSTTLPPYEAWHRMNAGALVLHRPGGATRVSAATELLWHALIHALVEPSEGFRLRFFLDAAVVWRSDRPIDWATIAARLESGELPDRRLALQWLGAAAWLGGGACPPSLVGAMPAFDLARALRWRLKVLALASTPPLVAERGPSWSMHPLTRARRLLIVEGTRALSGLPLTSGGPGAGPASGAARRAAAGVARLCFRGWRMFDQA